MIKDYLDSPFQFSESRPRRYVAVIGIASILPRIGCVQRIVCAQVRCRWHLWQSGDESTGQPVALTGGGWQ